MKTIIVVYSDTKVPNNCRLKKYAFNTKKEINKGDTISSPNYTTKMQVVDVLEESFKYYNVLTGDLSNEFNSTNQYEIRELVFTDSENIVIGTLV